MASVGADPFHYRYVQSTFFYHAIIQCSRASTITNVPLQIRKLNQDEAVRAFPRRGQMDLSEYVEAVRALQPGHTAAMDLGDLTTRAAKRRLGQAAAQLGRRLRWALATDTNVVYFQVLAAATPRGSQSAAAPASPPRPRQAPARAVRPLPKRRLNLPVLRRPPPNPNADGREKSAKCPVAAAGRP